MGDIDHPHYSNTKMRKINKITIIANDDKTSIETKNKLEKLLKNNNFEITDSKSDLAIAIGGDGTFINTVHKLNFDKNTYYVGINTGTLGFLQDINPNNLEDFVNNLNNNNFKTEKIALQHTEITTNKNKHSCYSLNEIVVRDNKFKTTHLIVKVNDKLLEEFAGDGLLVSTSLGSTAYNASLEGAMVAFDINCVQISPIAPLVNRVYKSLRQSIILPEKNIITIEPRYEKNNDLLVIVDGKPEFYTDVTYVKTKISDKKITYLRMNDYDYIDKIREKFLK